MDMYELEKLIIEAKKKYDSVFSSVIGDDLFIWRLLTQKELELIDKSASTDHYLKEELICQYAVLFPSDVVFSTWKAGMATTLSKQILYESGFSSVKKVYSYLDQVKNDLANNFISQAEIAICAAFPQYKFEEVQQWDIEKFLSMAARAEWKLQNIDKVDFAFQKTEDIEEAKEEIDSKEKVRQLEQELIDLGADPILCLYEDFYKKEKPYAEVPFIMGKNWDREDVCNAVIKKLSQGR